VTALRGARADQPSLSVNRERHEPNGAHQPILDAEWRALVTARGATSAAAWLVIAYPQSGTIPKLDV
jgi:hypothetical protein